METVILDCKKVKKKKQSSLRDGTENHSMEGPRITNRFSNSILICSNSPKVSTGVLQIIP